MRRYWFFLLLCKPLLGAEIFNSEINFENYLFDAQDFYEFYLAEQKDIDASVDLGTPARLRRTLNPPALPNPPADPSAPPNHVGYLAFVIVNNSGFVDTDVYISVIGAKLVGTGSDGVEELIS